MKSLLTLVAVLACSAQLSAAPTKIQGSDTLFGVMTDAIEKSKLNTDLQYIGGGSGKAEGAMIEQSQGVGPMSREVSSDAMTKLSAKGLKATGHVIALDGIALFINVRNRTSLLDLDTLRKIYLCDLKRWEDVPFSGTTGDIKVYKRDDASGTTDLVKHVLGIKAFGPCAKLATAEEITQQTANEDLAIGYAGLSAHLEGKNRPLTIAPKSGAKGVYPTLETIRNRTYPLSRNLYVYELGGVHTLSNAERELIQNVTNRSFMDPIIQKHEFFTLN